MPDYYSLNIGVSVLGIFGWNGSATIDRYGQTFLSPWGLSIGKSSIQGGNISLTANYVIQSSKPSYKETYNFLSGHGFSAGGGHIIGGVYNWSGSSDVSAWGFGFMNTQAGASYNYTPDNLIFNRK